MKKIVKKLSLNKQTMALLDEKEMTNVKGGFTIPPIFATCFCTTFGMPTRGDNCYPSTSS